MPETPLSTSALAKALGKTTKQMFSELESMGWILRSHDSWQLTSKGEFEGGSYRESQKFGRYIIWPQKVTQHPTLTNPDALLLSSSKLARHFSFSRKTMDQLLQEAGWVNAGRKGWLLTPQGEKVGGCQRENLSTAVPYVLWPAEMIEDKVLLQRVEQYQSQSEDFICCDGHHVTSDAEQQIDNWLYFAGLLHAYKRRLPFVDELYSDFYLPTYQIYIEYWGEGNTTNELPNKMRKKALLEEAGCRVIEVHDEELKQLDDYLTRALLKYGIET